MCFCSITRNKEGKEGENFIPRRTGKGSVCIEAVKNKNNLAYTKGPKMRARRTRE